MNNQKIFNKLFSLKGATLTTFTVNEAKTVWNLVLVYTESTGLQYKAYFKCFDSALVERLTQYKQCEVYGHIQFKKTTSKKAINAETKEPFVYMSHEYIIQGIRD